MILYQASPHLRVSPQEAVSRPRVIRVNNFGARAVHAFKSQVQFCISMGQPILPVVVDSYGGEAYGMFAMIDILDSARQHTKIATVVEGKAMSAGAWLFACGGDMGLRFVGPNATVMIHEGASGAVGKTSDLIASAQESKRLGDLAWAMLNKRCGQKPGYFESLAHDADNTDLYFTPEQAITSGMADAIGLPQMVVSVDVGFGFGIPETKAQERKRNRKSATKGKKVSS